MLNLSKVTWISTFKGEGIDKSDLRQYDQLYSMDVVQVLLHIPSKKNPIIRTVFSLNNFGDELTQFKMLCATLPGMFISFEPGPAGNHFIFCLIFNNTLLIINPMGETTHKDFYITLKNTNIFNEIIISNTVLQQEDQLVSCGPKIKGIAKNIMMQVEKGLNIFFQKVN